MIEQLPLALSMVTKNLAGRAILRRVDFRCLPGTVTGLLGPNGAGKTTTVTLSTGLRRPDNGQVRVFGIDPRHAQARRMFSLVPQEISFPGTIRVSECLDFVAGQRARSPFALARPQLSEELGIDEFRHRSIGALSGGQRRRLALALGLLEVPGLLVLDEATSNLDDQGRQTTWRLVRDYANRGGTVLATTHILADIEAHADRVVTMVDGRVVRNGSIDEVRAALGGSTVSAVIPPTLWIEISRRIAAAGLASCESFDAATSRGEWRTTQPVALVALIAACDVDAGDLMVCPTPLSDLLTEQPAERDSQNQAAHS
jgi:ABC-2 type transport system ATP-binding protein